VNLVSGILAIHWCMHHGRHFGRTVYAMCNFRSLITNGLHQLKESDDGEISEESLTSEYVSLVNLSIPLINIDTT
jgi:hypothetical protein